MKQRDWLWIIGTILGLVVSASSLAFREFETKDANRGQHALMIDMLRDIRAELNTLNRAERGK